MTDLRNDIHCGLSKITDESGEPATLDQHGRAEYVFEHPAHDGMLVQIGVLLGPGDDSFSLQCVLGAFGEQARPEGFVALLEANRRIGSADGAIFACDEATGKIVLVQHWPMSRISEEQFQQLFTSFCVQSVLWINQFMGGGFSDARMAWLQGE